MTYSLSQRVPRIRLALLVVAVALFSFVLFAPIARANGTDADKQCTHPEKYVEGKPMSYVDPTTGKHGVIGQPCADFSSKTTGKCVSLTKCNGIMCNGKPCQKTEPPGGPKPPEKKDGEKPPEAKMPELPKPPESKPKKPSEQSPANCDVSGAFGGGREGVDANGKPCPKTSQTLGNQDTSQAPTAAAQLSSLADSPNPEESAKSGKSGDVATNEDNKATDKPKGFGGQLAAYFSNLSKSLSKALSPAPAADSANTNALNVTDTGKDETGAGESSTMHSNSTFNVPTGIQNMQVPDSFFVQVNKSINDLILNFASTLGIH